jgi:hypothetical protein
MSVSGAQRVVAVLVIALVAGVLGVAGPSHADTGIIRILIPGAFASPSGTSADGQVALRIGVGLPVFQVNTAGAPVGGSIATATFAQWTDTVLTPDIGTQSTLMVFRLPDGLMVTAAGVATPNGLATSFSATAPFQALTGAWDLTTGPTPSDALVTFAYDTNTHIKETGLLRFVAVGGLSGLVTKSIPALASVDAVRNVPVFDVQNNAKGTSVGNLAGHSAYNITGHTSEFVDLRVIRMVQANLSLLYGCAFPTPTTGIACLVGGTGFATHLSGRVTQVAGALRKNTISGVTDADLVLELDAQFP